MVNVDEIRRLFININPKLSIALIVRSSLRVLPLSACTEDKQEAFFYWKNSSRTQNIFLIFSALQASVSYSISDSKKLSARAIGLGDTTRLSIYEDIFYCAQDAHRKNNPIAAHAVLSTCLDVEYLNSDSDFIRPVVSYDNLFDANPYEELSLYSDSKAENIARENAEKSTKLDSAYLVSQRVSDVLTSVEALGDSIFYNDIEKEILIDLDYIKKNHENTPISLFQRPLWSLATPNKWEILWANFTKHILSIDNSFRVWLDWYEDRVIGKELDVEREERWFYIPPEIKDQGLKATSDYISTLGSSSSNTSISRPLNLVRGIFIGSGAAGKTSLIRLLHNEAVVEGKEEMTAGIKIREWPVPNTEIKARLWDFGGQVMSHSTHQFFLRERCLYILVLDARTEFNANDQAEYWLEHVKAFGKNSPVMLVGNKSDLTSVNLDMHALVEKYPNIVGFYPISCTKCIRSDEGDETKVRFVAHFETFRMDLIENLQKVGMHQIYFTDEQFDVLKILQKRSTRETLLSHREFEDLCQKHGIGEVGLNKEDFLGVLDKLGEVIHFSNMPTLNDYVLNPRWLTYGVYTLLYSRVTDRQQGVLSKKDVINILQEKSVKDEDGIQLDYPNDKCGFIIEAMEQFHLCYRLPEDRNKFVIPDKLPSKQPMLHFYFDKNKDNSLIFEFDFKGFLPRHVMPALIVSRHEEIVKDDLGKQLVWQNGVIIQHKSHLAIARLQVDYHQRLLIIWVQGEGAREYLAILNDEVNKILSRMNNLDYDEKIVLPVKALVDIKSFRGESTLEKATYRRLLIEAKEGNNIFISDSGNKYYINKILGFIMTKDQQKKKGMSIVVNGNVGAIGGSGDNHKVSGNVTLSTADKQAVNDLRDSVASLTKYIESYDNDDFQIKNKAYNQLLEINEHLTNVENASPEIREKLIQMLSSIKDGSFEALELGKEIKEANETVTWVIEKAAIVSAFLSTLPL